MIRFVIVAAAIWLGFAAQAVGQTRDIYTIRDITVEEEADSVIEAQQQAFMSARIEGAYQIIDRLTLPEDRAGKLEPDAITPEVASQLAAAVDVEQETRGGNRYVGKLAVVYNPVNVRDFLKARGIPYIDQPAPKAVVFPVSDRFPPSVWAEAWPDRSVGQLAPYDVSRTPLVSAFSGWPELEADVQAASARRAIKAVLDGSRGAFRVDLYSVTAAGEVRLGTTGAVPTLEAAVDAASSVLDYVWKSQSIIRTEERTPARSTVFFTSLVEWNSLRSAMARSPLVEDFVIEGLSRTGAVVAFVHAGDTNRLISNLRERGIMLDPDPSGWVMTTAVSRGADLGVE